MVRKNNPLYRLVITAVLLALGMVLPFLTGQIPTIGQMISPLHIPVFICALTCGWGWGAAVAIPMAVEMAVYGAVTGLLYRLLRRKFPVLAGMLLAMLVAMIAGRIAGGGAKALVMGLQGTGYTFSAFIAGYFTGTAVGAVIHLILCPVVALALEKAKLSPGA